MKLKLTIFMSMVATIQALSQSGRNVCSTTKTVSFKLSQPYATNCGFLGWARCNRNRVVTRYKTAIDYNCCTGWTSTDNVHCDVAICKALPPGECPNGGKCIKPGECSCASGFNEPICEDINECDTNKGGCSSKCINTVGSYHCACEVGYGLLDDKKTCRAVCQGQKPGMCPNEGTCVTPETCECTTGFSQPTCADINECSNSSGGCEQHCINTQGSYHCTCNYGYRLLKDQRSCRPICFGLTPGTCANKGTCIKPTVCQCLTGYSLPNCSDIDECKEDKGGCSDLCENSIGSYRCKCASGYRLMNDHHTCTDINECMSMNGGCPQICQNYPGYNNCSCFRGYNLADNGVTCQECTNGTWGGDCKEICSVNCRGVDSCNIYNGSCPAGCADGFEGSVCQTKSSRKFNPGAVIGGAVGAAFVVILVLVIFILKCRRKVARKDTPVAKLSPTDHGQQLKSAVASRKTTSHESRMAGDADYVNVDNGDYFRLDFGRQEASSVYASLS